MDSRLASALRLLPEYLSEHVLLSASALGLGLLISLPLLVAASRHARVRWPVLAAASLIQTVPSLALLALFYPILLALSSLADQLFGRSFSALGFLPSLLALTLYSMLPILRNGATALAHLDPAVLEAARGVGMTRSQQLWRVELPLAAPFLMAGVRTSAVWVIGTATLSTPVGQTSLGNFIFSGLQVENWVAVLVGCVAAVVLALATDHLLALIERGIERRQRAPVAWGAALLLAGIGAAFLQAPQSDRASYVVGAKSFTEQYILAALIADRIGDEGGRPSRRVGLGSAVAFRALANDDLDVYVDYSGTLWSNVLARQDAPERAALLRQLTAELRDRYGVTVLGSLGFENAYALAMRRDRAEALQISTIADLAQHAPDLTLGADFEFLARPEWAALRDRYGLRFARRRQFQSTFMYRAVAGDEVQVISAFSSDGRIAAYDLIVLEDPLGAILPYDAVVLLSPSAARDPLLRRALSPLLGAIPIDLMRRSSLMVDAEEGKVAPAQAAAWLAARAGIGD